MITRLKLRPDVPTYFYPTTVALPAKIDPLNLPAQHHAAVDVEDFTIDMRGKV